MNELLFENTKVSAYFLWEYTMYSSALELWYCAEDISSSLECNNILSLNDMEKIKLKDIRDGAYINFVRHIAFRIFIYTNVDDSLKNWFIAERLLNNSEWCSAITSISSIYHQNRDCIENLSGIRSEKVRSYYKETY